ncbi:MAG: DUF2986 domain-containing protein [Algicola sp.]|nr:DUF2986 domain-containing protein [Algicola sp.]
MNRKKKLNDRLKKKVKKTNAKLRSSNKSKYISKADRAAVDGEAVVVVDGEENN